MDRRTEISHASFEQFPEKIKHDECVIENGKRIAYVMGAEWADNNISNANIQKIINLYEDLVCINHDMNHMQIIEYIKSHLK